MFSRIKYGKFAIVVFLTVLIWVWADLALDETAERTGRIEVGTTATPAVWVSFSQSSSVPVTKLSLAGPHSALRRISKTELRFDFDAVQEQMDKPGSYTLRLLPFLQKNKELRRWGLKVKSCEPETVEVNVVALVNRELTVECVDEAGKIIKARSILPATVIMNAPEETRNAQVRLTRAEIERARTTAVEKTPFVNLSAGQIRKADKTVKVTMPAEASALSEATVTSAKLGIAMSINLSGKYSVQVENLNDVISLISIRATAAAKQAYESMRYQVILEVDDDDVKLEEVRRDVLYNFPPEFAGRNEIALNQPPAQAKFRLKALPAGPAEADGAK